MGFAALSATPAPKGWLMLEPVAIAPEFQGRGFGKRLIGMIAQWAEMTGNTLIVREPATHAQSSLFRSCGFTPLPEGFDVPQSQYALLICGAGKAKIQQLSFPKPLMR